MAVEFIVSDDEAYRFLSFLQSEELSLFYVKLPVEYNAIKGPAN